MSHRARTENERGRALADQGDPEGAIQAYRAAASEDESWAVPWYNMGLVYKYEGTWDRSAECNRQALRRDASEGDAWWNLGIAATALGEWQEARAAWRRCGLDVPDGEGPLELDYGPTPIRLNPGGRGEVVWCDRIDPARAIIRNIPFPESGSHYGDLILHDGAPNGTRQLAGKDVPVFDALACLTTSSFETYVLDVAGSTPAQRSLATEVALELGVAAEDWSQSVRFLCRSCSEGSPHEAHDRDLADVRPDLALAVAVDGRGALESLITTWRERAAYDGVVLARRADP